MREVQMRIEEVSVSSADRWWVQAGPDRETTERAQMFQYPQRIDGGFKVGRVASLRRTLRVSVSSADRWWVQAGAAMRTLAQLTSFSILSGSMVGSRRKSARTRWVLIWFQYPQRIDGGFKSLCIALVVCSKEVSVSSADRWWVQDAVRRRLEQEG